MCAQPERYSRELRCRGKRAKVHTHRDKAASEKQLQRQGGCRERGCRVELPRGWLLRGRQPRGRLLSRGHGLPPSAPPRTLHDFHTHPEGGVALASPRGGCASSALGKGTPVGACNTERQLVVGVDALDGTWHLR